VLTAGGGDEQVADNGPGGHSIFTWTLLQGLDGKGDLDGDGAITATELAAYVAPAVSSLSRQTPAFGHLSGSEGGELVFVLKPEDEFLSEESRQLDGEAIQLNGQLDRIRKEIEEKKARNQKLKSAVAAATAELGAGAVAAAAAAPVKPGPDGGAAAASAPRGASAAADDASERVRREIQHGMSLYREKRYEEAAKSFEAVLALRPGHVMATNNLGFTYFKLGRMADAVTWYEKAIALDPGRAIAYANLGDAYAQLNRPADAKRAYQKFLELQPRSKLAAGVQQKLAVLP
jgi:tetratricopeptide (TPR) repeat protein